MPELPDVELLRRYLAATALHQEIQAVEVGDDQVLTGLSPRGLALALRGRSFAGASRHGKFLFARVDGEGHLAMHFGMTGFLKYFRRPQVRPRHARIQIAFANGYFLAYSCQRKLGEVTWADDPAAFAAQRGLGPDALGRDLDLAAFRAAVQGRRAAAKSLLLDQTALAGVGNLYADEILFQARIHPTTSVAGLKCQEQERLFRAMKQVLATAVRCRADPGQFPLDYLLPRRGAGGRCPRCGRCLQRMKVSGRTTYYCSGCQPPPLG
ncbi:MAG: Fpg/Nei family DNA glycosylase [Candidatus Bipolaricaulaceae bacterium]